MIQFSVIIPTYNRCELLRNAVISIQNQDFPPNLFEILVVDNASKDRTRKVVDGLNQSGLHPVRYVREERPGLVWARHAGAWAAKGEILVYTDDDAIAEPDWLSELARAYQNLTPDAAGGKILIRWDDPPKPWVTAYEGFLGRIDHGPEARLLEKTEYINGGNFSIQRSRLFEVGGFNPDQIGETLIGDGESGLVNKIHQANLKLAWVPKAMVWHCQVAQKNGTLSDLKRRFSNQGASDTYSGYQQATRHGPFFLLARAVKMLIYGLAYKAAAFLKYRTKDPKFYSREFRAAYLFRRAQYEMRLIFDKKLREFSSQKDWINLPYYTDKKKQP